MNLDDLAVAVRSRLADVAISVSSVDVTHRSPDLLLSYPSVGADALGEILAAMSPKIVFLSSSFFDAQELDDISDDLLRSAKEHDGDLYSLSVVWVADGLLHAWFATAEWHDDLTEKIELDEYEAQTADETERKVDYEKSRTAHRKLLDLVLSTAQFREASTNRRTAQAQIVMDANAKLVTDVMFPGELVKEARQLAAVEVGRWEAELQSDTELLNTVVDVLRSSRTVADQRLRIAQLLRDRTDGWTLSDSFTERLRHDGAARLR